MPAVPAVPGGWNSQFSVHLYGCLPIRLFTYCTIRLLYYSAIRLSEAIAVYLGRILSPLFRGSCFGSPSA